MIKFWEMSWTAGHYVCYALAGWNNLQMPVKSNWSFRLDFFSLLFLPKCLFNMEEWGIHATLYFFSIKNKLLLSMNQCLRWWIANDVPWLNFGHSRFCVIPSSFSCSVGFMIIYSITLCLLWKNNFISVMNYSTAGYNNLGCQIQIPPFIDPCVLALRSSAKNPI